jgi:hypothetical protein
MSHNKHEDNEPLWFHDSARQKQPPLSLSARPGALPGAKRPAQCLQVGTGSWQIALRRAVRRVDAGGVDWPSP